MEITEQGIPWRMECLLLPALNILRTEFIYKTGSGYKSPCDKESHSGVCFLFPTVSDPDILTWINQHSLPFHDCQDRLKEEQAGNIICVGHPLRILSENKVFLPSVYRKIARVPWDEW